MTCPQRSLVIAHRGASGYRPENTLTAFALAVDQGADMIETDLHRSRDGVITIRHDEELASLGGKRGIADSDIAEIKKLDAGDGEVIPTLDEVLDRFGQTIPFNLEIKTGPKGAYPELEAEALAAVEERGLLDSTLFSSFDDGVLQRLRARSSKARLAVLVSPHRPKRGIANAIERAEDVSAEAINPGLRIAGPEWIQAAHDKGLAVYVYTVNEEEEMCQLLAAGADGLFTNYPDLLRRRLPLPFGA